MTKRESTWTPCSCTHLYNKRNNPLTKALERRLLITYIAFLSMSAIYFLRGLGAVRDMDRSMTWTGPSI